MKNIFLAMSFALAFVAAPAIIAVPHAAAQEAASLETMEAEIEALLVANANDPEAFAAAVEAYVLAAADAGLSTDAVINVLTNPKGEAAQLALANNPGLKAAGGQGLGAAIAQIGLTNPTVAANMQAKVEASNDETLQASVTEGNAERTASIQQQQAAESGDTAESNDSTPETPVSPN